MDVLQIAVQPVNSLLSVAGWLMDVNEKPLREVN
jgi:hypothetical protein